MEMPDTPMSLDNDAPFPIDEAADFRDIYERTFDQQQDSYMSDDSSSRKRKAKDMAEPVTCELENDRISRRDFAPSFTPTNPKSPAEPQPNTASLEVSPGLTPLPPPFSTNLEADHRHIAPIDLLRGVVRRALEAVRPREMIPMSCQDGEVVLIKMEGPRGRIYEVKVSYTVARHVPARIITKELNLKWILTKAVDNALKFTLEGEIALHMRLSRSGQLVETTVIDTGCGISEESKEHVFKPHFQEDSTISRLREGLGLSLFNAKAHARKHLKGDMTLERSDTDGPNRGSEFLIRFPLITRPRGNNKFATFLTDTIAPECPPLPRLSSCSSTSHSINGVINGTAGEIPFTPLLPLKLRLEVKKPPFDRELGSKIPLQILVVDDNLVNRNILEGYLKRLGYPSTSISLAFDGVEAVQRYEASLAPDAKPVDAILMDLWMPNMDGYQATERIMEVAKGSGRCPKVFAVTADITVESEERTKKAGMHGFVSKPYRVTDVQRLIVEHFGGGRG